MKIRRRSRRVFYFWYFFLLTHHIIAIPSCLSTYYPLNYLFSRPHSLYCSVASSFLFGLLLVSVVRPLSWDHTKTIHYLLSNIIPNTNNSPSETLRRSDTRRRRFFRQYSAYSNYYTSHFPPSVLATLALVSRLISLSLCTCLRTAASTEGTAQK